ncbi:flagellar protein, partial [Helicobacter pylori]
MKKQILTGVLLSVLAVSSAYAHKDKKDAKKPKFSTELVVAHKDKKDAKKPELSSQLVAHKDKKDAKKP